MVMYILIVYLKKLFNIQSVFLGIYKVYNTFLLLIQALHINSVVDLFIYAINICLIPDVEGEIEHQ